MSNEAVNHMRMNGTGGTGSPRLISGTLVSIGVVVSVAAILKILQHEEPSVIVPLLLLATVLSGAARFGTAPGLAAAVSAFAAYNFLFVEPHFTFRVANVSDMITLGVFLLTAGLTGWLAGRLREAADAASRRAGHLDRLAHLTASLADSASGSEVLDALAREAHGLGRGAAIILMRSGETIRTLARHPSTAELPEECLPIAARTMAYQTVQAPAAYGSTTRNFAFYPAGLMNGEPVAVAAAFPDTSRPLIDELDRTLRMMAVQAGEALERISRAAEAMEAAQEAQTEQLRSGLLLSLSHDLRTPLAGILGSISSLREPSLKLTAAARADLLTAAEEETRRLSRYVDDLLALTRMKSGLKPDFAMVDAVGIAEDAVARARALHPAVHYVIKSSAKSLAIQTDAALLGQAFFNLLDNAARHGPQDGEVVLKLAQTGNVLSLSVTDEGKGIDPSNAAQIFDPLFRGKDSVGTGLGLAIVKSAVMVLGGRIETVSPVTSGRGTSFIITLPDTP